MPDYKTLYFRLFNAITDALTRLACGEPETARDLLINAQRDAEETVISSGE